MNAVEIEQAISELSELDFNDTEFPFQFLTAFGNKEPTIKKLRKGVSNKSDIPNGILQRNNIHIVTCKTGEVQRTFNLLKSSPANIKGKVKFILTTDGDELQAEDLTSGETIACDYAQFPNHFGFFLPLAGISTVKQIRDNPIDIQATSRLNRLYIELLKINPEWNSQERRQDMNQFMGRLIFCFYAEDTDIFAKQDLFTETVEQMSNNRSQNTDYILKNLFHAMDTPYNDRTSVNLPRWANAMPYVNGGLFSGTRDVPKFNRVSRSYLLHAGNLNWSAINPDIFGSMIQALADEDERGKLGMHYTSVPNILNVLNPLFLDELRNQLKEAENNSRKLLNLKKRMSRIRVFDPACGSGNFLVIAYKEMRKIEFEINSRRNETFKKSIIPLSNFRGIELKEFPAEIARLSLIIAEFQSDILYRGQKDALREFLPLDSKNWIVYGNSLQMDWLSICPPTENNVKLVATDLFHKPENQTEIDFENEGGETFICGNPPYLGSSLLTKNQKNDMKSVCEGKIKDFKSLDYVAAWFIKAAEYMKYSKVKTAFVSTNSICQGQQVPILWSFIFNEGMKIDFAYQSFKWKNLATHNAGVVVTIIGISIKKNSTAELFSMDADGQIYKRSVDNINGYLVPSENIEIRKKSVSLSGLSNMLRGNMPYDGGNLLLNTAELGDLNLKKDQYKTFIRKILGAAEFIKGKERYCIWVEKNHKNEAIKIESLKNKFEAVRLMRLNSPDKTANEMAKYPYQMREMNIGKSHAIITPCYSSENRGYIPAGLIDRNCTITNLCYGIFDGPIWNLAILASKLHFIWIDSICGHMGTGLRYSNTMGWNTFPLPRLTEKNKDDLTRCAEGILLARESHFPTTIADLYDPDNMPKNLRAAHHRNDEVIERIYIGRRFKNDTERLEKLFELYSNMTSAPISNKRVL